jgi:hypothetical protein
LKIGVFDTIGAPGFDDTPPKILPNLFLKSPTLALAVSD